MIDIAKKLSKESIEYMTMKNRHIFEYCNFHLHTDIDVSDWCHVMFDGYEEENKEWHGCKTYYGIQWLFQGKGQIEAYSYYDTTPQQRVDMIQELQSMRKVNSLGESMSGWAYPEDEYTEIVDDDVYHMCSAGNAGAESCNVLATHIKCLAIAATSLSRWQGKYSSDLLGYSSWDYPNPNSPTRFKGKPVDIAGVGDLHVIFYADGKWREASYGGTSMRHIVIAGIVAKNGCWFKEVHGRWPDYQEMNEMMFNFCKDVNALRKNLELQYRTDQDKIDFEYATRVGFGNAVLASVLVNHWATWYYSFLKDFCNLRPIWGASQLSDSITRGEIAIMMANIWADFNGRTNAADAVRALNDKGIPFKGRITNGQWSLALDETVTRKEFFVMVRRLLEFIDEENTGLDFLDWPENAEGSMLYVLSKIKVFNIEDNDWTLDKGSACAIFSRMKGYIEWSEKQYI